MGGAPAAGIGTTNSGKDRTLVISLEGCRYSNEINERVDKFTVRTGLGAAVRIGVVHPLK